MSPLGLVNLLPATTVNLNVGLGMAQLRTNADAKSLDNVKNKILGACWTSFGQSNVWAGFLSLPALVTCTISKRETKLCL